MGSWGTSWGDSWGQSFGEVSAPEIEAPPFDMHDGVDYAERSREKREQDQREQRDQLKRIIRAAFETVTGTAEPQAFPPRVERQVAQVVIRSIRLEGLDDIATSVAEVRQLIRTYEQARDEHDAAIALLLLAA